MAAPRITNRAAGSLVRCKREFRGSNLYAEYVGDTYVCYSYGEHFPLYMHHDGQWYVNMDSYSVTTSRHRNQAHPGAGIDLVESDTDTMKGMRRAAELLAAVS